jgi:hypothetical protein
MATNQTTVTVSLETTYSLPISYSAITMVSGVEQQEQLLLFRSDIEDIYGSSLSLREYRGLGQIASSWLTLDEIDRKITQITIPPSATFTMDNGSVVSYPALVGGETLLVQRVNIVAEPYVTWTTGARITADQLNLNTSHLLGLIQETKYTAEQGILRTDADAVVNPMQSDLDADGNKITNLATPTNNLDAATKAYVDSAINTAVTSKLGVPNGIATLNAEGLLETSQHPTASSQLPATFFARSTPPVRGTANQGLFEWGSLWYSLTNGRLYVYIPDNNFDPNTEAYDGEVGYWVDVSSPAL